MREVVALALGSLYELCADGKEAVLDAVGHPVRVAVERALDIGLAHAVEVVYVVACELGVARLAAARVDDYGVVGQAHVGVIGPDAAQAAYLFNVANVSENSHHARDAALGEYLVDYLGLGHAALGQGLLDVVYHDREGPVAAYVLLHGLAAERVCIGQGSGRRLRRGRGSWSGLRSGREVRDRVRQGALLGRHSAAGGQGEKQRNGERCGNCLFHR